MQDLKKNKRKVVNKSTLPQVPCQAQHPPAQQVRTHANYPPACTPCYGRNYGRNLSYLLRQGQNQVVHPLYRYVGEQVRLPGQQTEYKEIYPVHPSVHRRLREPRLHVDEAQVADKVRIRHQDYPRSEPRLPAI